MTPAPAKRTVGTKQEHPNWGENKMHLLLEHETGK
jgi:hypothetical protein